MKARSLPLAAAALLAAGCSRDPAPPPSARVQPTQASEVRLVAPVSAEGTAEAQPLAPAASPSPAEATAQPRPLATPAASPLADPPVASYPPKHECAALPGFATFREKLGAAVRKRDAAAVAALAAPDIRLDFGGGAGRDELRSRLSSRAELWRQLGEVLRLGCAADGDLATMPWVFSRMPEAVDPYRAMLVLGDKVALRERPAADAPVRAELAWALVVPVSGEPDPKARFVEVAIEDRAVRGFVERGSLRSLLDYRLVAEPQAGGWAITAFIAGD